MKPLLAGATVGLLLAAAGCATHSPAPAADALPADAIVGGEVVQLPAGEVAPPRAPTDPATPEPAPAAGDAANEDRHSHNHRRRRQLK